MFLTANRSQMNLGFLKYGIITSVDPSNYAVKVMIKPEDVETGFIPFGTPFYGWVAPPKGGEQCIVLFEAGDTNVPFCAILLYWDNYRAPGVDSDGDTAPGEMLFKHSSGSYIKLKNDGKILINGQTEIDITTPKLQITTTGDVDVNAGGDANIVATGNAKVQGDDVTVQGNTVSLGDGSTPESLAFYQALKNYIDSHEHTNVQGGSSNSGPPSSPLPSSVSTQVVKAV